MKHQLLTLSLALFTTCSAFAVGETFTQNGVVYTVKENNTVGITDATSDCTGALTLTSKVTNDGTEYTLVSIDEDAFYWSKITSVNIPATVKTLDKGAFRSCNKLASVTFDEGSQLTTIGDNAFYGATFPTIAIPEGVTSIGGSCFFTCTSLTSISLPSTLTTIGTSCFYKSGLTSVSIPASVTDLGAKAFLFCNKLASVTLPADLTELKAGTFNGTKALTSISIPATVTSIGDECFLDSGLAGEITLPRDLANIGSGAFVRCPITSFSVAPGNTNFTKVGECIYSADKRLLYLYPMACANTVVTVDNACVGIAGGAFWNSNVTKVTLPEGFRAFDEFSFCQAASLTEINMPSTVVFLGEQSFAGTGLTSFTVPEGVVMLPEAVFASSPALSTVTLPSSLTYMDIRVFLGCTALTTVNSYASTAPTLEDWYEEYESPFYNVPSTCKLHVPAGCKSNYTGSWTDVFTSSRIIEDLPGYAAVETITPADGNTVESLTYIQMNFAADSSATYTVQSEQPAITVQAGPLAAGVPVGDIVAVGHWTASLAGTASSLTLTPRTADGAVQPLNLADGTEYYITIPAGIVADNTGKVNERRVLHYVGSYVELPSFEPTSFNPENDATIRYFDGVTLNFDEDVTAVRSKLSGAKFLKGTMSDDGTVTGTDALGYDFEEWSLTTSKRSPRIWPADMDYYTVSVTLADYTDYYMIIPAGLFKNAAGVETEQFILHYSNGSTGVELVDESDTAVIVRTGAGSITVNAADAAVEVYTISGISVANTRTVSGEASISGLADGIYVVRTTQDGTVKTVKVRI